jgi:hypothetical protein
LIRQSVRAAFIFVFSIVISSELHAQTRVGALYGSVVSQGAPIAGATIVAQGTAAPFTATSDDRGQFRILNLPPGTYRLEITARGFLPAARENIVVSVGQSTTIDGQLVAAAADVRVTASEAPIERRQVLTGTTLPQAELDGVPTARDIWEAARMAPGVLVDRVNVAGNESTEPSAMSGPGFSMTQQTWSVDGVNITDSVTPGIAASFLDFDAFEEVQVTTGGSDVGVPTGGAVNLVTRHGTNDWRGSVHFSLANEAMQAGLQLDPSKLGKAGPWNLGTAQRAFDQANRIDISRKSGFDLGGPLVRDRLWFWGALGRQDIDVFTIGDFREQTAFTSVSLKVDGRVGLSGRWQALYMRNERDKQGRNVGPLRLPETAWSFPVTTGIAKVEGSAVVRNRIYLSAAGSHVQEDLIAEPGGGRAVNAVINPSGVWTGSFLYGVERRPQVSVKADARSFFAAGGFDSELRWGVDYRFAWTDAEAGWPGAGGVIGLGTAIQTVGLPLGIATVGSHNKDSRTIAALYVQDTLRRGALTAMIGLRLDMQGGANRASTLPRNELLSAVLPGVAFAGLDSPFTWRTVTPKLGLTYAVGATGRTVLKTSYRQFPDELSLTDIQHTNPTRHQAGGLIGAAQSATFLWFDNGDLKFRPSEIGTVVALTGVDPLHPGVSPNRVADGFHSPRTHEVIAGLDRDLGHGAVLSVDVTWNRTSGPRQFERLVLDASAQTARAHTRDDYSVGTRLSGTLPDGATYDVPVYRLKPNVSYAGGTLLTNGDRRQDFVGLTASVHKRLSNGLMLRGWATVNRWTWDVASGAISDPTPRVAGDFDDGGLVVQDTASLGGVKTSVFLNSRWSFNASGSYRVAASRPWSVDVAADLYGRQGYPIPYFRAVTAAETGDGIDRQVRVAPEAATYRNDNVVNANLRVAKEFRFGRTPLVLGLDVFNLFNRTSVLQRQHELGLPVGDHVIEVVSPRVFSINARLRFR